MTYQETLDFLFEQIPSYQKEGKSAYKANLDNITTLCESLDNPQEGFNTIHIAGTNGKGSTSHILASILQEAGYRVGLYTSPHLLDFRERIKINGELIPEQDVVDFVERTKASYDKIEPSFFEITVAMAFDYFNKMDIDLAIVETGLGGRLDATNVLKPDVTVITHIGMDHTHILGDRIEDIAREKGGIIKNGVPLVIGEFSQLATPILIDIAEERGAPYHMAYQDEIKTFPCDLKGTYQPKNMRTARKILEVMEKMNGWKVNIYDIRQGFSRVVPNTGLRGRWEILDHKPLTICDIAHNPDGIKEVVKQIQMTPFKKLHFVIGLSNDKKPEEILDILPREARYYFCQADIKRAYDAQELMEKSKPFGLEGKVYPSVEQAYRSAQDSAEDKDLIFIGGSAFIVAEVLECEEKKKNNLGSKKNVYICTRSQRLNDVLKDISGN